MKSIANQYRDLKEGRMSQGNFMRNLRMMMPQYITNVTSFDDAVRILKNKAILTELGPAAQQSAGNPDEEAEYKSSLIKKKSQEDDEEEIQALIDKYAEEESGKYTTGEDQFEISEGNVEKFSASSQDRGATGSELEFTIEKNTPEYFTIAYKITPNSPFRPKSASRLAGKREVEYGDQMIKKDYSLDPYQRKWIRVKGINFGPISDKLVDMLYGEELNEKSYKVSKDAIPVSSLKKGDVLAGSNLEVVSISTGAKTPSGKMEVTVKDPKTGKEITKVWGKSTKVTIKKDLKENMTDPDSEDFTLAVEDYLDSGKWGLTPEQEKEALIYLEDNYYDLQGDFANNHTVDGGAYAAAKYIVSVVKSKEDLNEAKKKKEAKAELHPNQIHPQELRMGIKVELEHTDDLDKAKKIALDHLAENPYYYTALKLAGVESPSAPKVKAPVEKKAKKKKEAVELVDKANAMQKVKMPKDKINEDYESWLSQKKGEEARAKRIMQATNAEGVKFSVNDIAKTPDGKEIKITGFTTGKDGKMKAMYSAGMFADVYNLDDLEKKSSFRPGVDLGASFDKFKASLEEVVREVIAEYYDGRDNLDAENEY